MEKNNVNATFLQYQDLIPQEQKLNFKRSLEKADDNCIDNLMMVKTYNPMLILICSIFLGGFGIDRFLIGDTALGVCKLLFGWLTLGIWPLIDIFFSYQTAKEKNLFNLLSVLR